MNSNHQSSSNTLQFTDIIQLARRYQLFLVLFIGTVIGIAYVAAIILPKKYSTKTIFQIKAQYFNIPQISDFLPYIYAEEIRSQRTHLINKALNQSFLEIIGNQHSILHGSKGSSNDRIL